MAASGLVERYMGIRERERARAFRMFAYYSLCSAGAILVETSADTLFLTRFVEDELLGFRGVEALPLLWIASGLLVVPFLSWLRERAASVGLMPPQVVIVTTGFVVAMLLLFRALFALAGSVPLLVLAFPAFIVGSEVFFTLSAMNMEVSANQLFNVREAKRVFGFIGGGTIVAHILTGFSTGGLVRLCGSVENLLFVAAGVMVGSGVLFQRISRTHIEAFAVEETEEEESDRETGRFSVWRSRYVLLIALLVLLSQLSYYLVDYQFKTTAAARFAGEPEELAGFLGAFFGGLGFVKLLLQFFVTSRLLKRFGIFIALLILPAGLILLATSVAADPFRAFLFLCSLKAYDNVFRWTFLASSMPLLYQALPSGIAAKAQARITGTVDPASAGVSGLALIVLTQTLLGTGELYLLSWALVIVALGWVVLTFTLKRRYLSTLAHYTQQRRLGADFDLADPAFLATLTEHLQSEDVQQVAFCADVMEKINPPDFYRQMERLLEHPDPAAQAVALRKLAAMPEGTEASGSLRAKVRDRLPKSSLDGTESPDRVQVQALAIRVYSALLDEDAVEEVVPLLEAPNVEIKAAAVAGLLSFGGLDGILSAGPVLKSMLTHTSPEERIAACRLIAGPQFRSLHRPIRALVDDPSPEVRREAVISAGATGDPSLVPLIVDALADPDVQSAAVESLVRHVGEPAVELLQGRLMDQSAPLLLRRSAARTLAHFPTPASFRALAEAMLLENETLRGDALQALVQVAERMNVRDPGKALNVLDGEVSDYFATLGVLVHLPEGEEALLLRTALEERLVAVQRRVLACLKLIYGPSIISTAELCLWSASQDMRARGMEVLDNVLDDAHKADVLTAFDDIEPARKMAYAAGRFSLSDPSPQSFLGELFGSGWGRYSPWVKVVCVRTAPSLALALSAERLAEILLTNDTDVVREECLHALARQGPAMARGLLDQIACEPDSSLGAAVRRYRSGEGPMLSTLDKVLFLKSVPLFSHVQDEHLVELALKAKEVFFPNASPILRRGEMGDFMYVIISGAVCIHIGEERLAEFRKGGVFGEMAILDAEPRAADVTALEDTELLRIGQKDLLNAMTSEVEISRGVIKELSQRIRHMNDANSFRDALRRAWKAGMTPEEEAEFLEARRTGTRISAAEAAQLAAEVKEDLGIGAR